MNNQSDNVREVSSKRKLEGANDSDLEQTPVPSKRLTKGEKRRMRRREFVYKRERAERKQAALNAMGFLPVDAPANIGVIRLERRKDLPQRMAGHTWHYDDEIFDSFRKFGHRGTGMFVVLDKATDELVFAARITETKDMDPEKREMFNRIFTYFKRGEAYYPDNKTNAAKTHGTMKAIGWRAAMEPGQAYGTYAPNRKAKDSPEEWKAHSMEALQIHRLYAESFRTLAPRIYEGQVKERMVHGVPLLGVSDGAYQENIEDLFCSNLAWTYSK
jgi:hypothetical protein